jgi:hypothetical protein
VSWRRAPPVVARGVSLLCVWQSCVLPYRSSSHMSGKPPGGGTAGTKPSAPSPPPEPAQAPSSTTHAPAELGDEHPDDPIVSMLMQQVSSLMRERAAQAEAIKLLQRDNEALQELVGYLAGDEGRDVHPD